MIINRFKKFLNAHKYKFNNSTNYFSELTEDSAQMFIIHLSLNVYNNNILIVMQSEKEAEKIYTIAKDFFSNSDKKIYYFPSYNIAMYQKNSPNASTIIKRVSTLSALGQNKENSIVITSSAGILQKTLPNQIIKDKTISLQVNQNIDINQLKSFLVENNYQRTHIVHNLAEFAVRGDIIDIYTANYGAVRINFFGDTIENMRVFDPISQTSIKSIESITLQPSTEIILEEKYINNFKNNYFSQFKENNNAILDLLNNKILPRGIENYLSLFYDKTDTILDFIEPNNIIFGQNAIGIIKQIQEDYENEFVYRTSLNSMSVDKMNILPVSNLILTQQEIEHIIETHNISQINHLKEVESKNSFNLKCKIISTEFNIFKNTNKNIYKATINFIKNNMSNQFLIFAHSDDFISKISNELKLEGIDFLVRSNDLINYNNKVTIIHDKDSLINEGFIFENLMVLTETEITGVTKTFSNKIPKRKIKSNTIISKGDIVVHVKHGFGRCNGIVTLKVNGNEHDFLEIEYKNSEKLYIPVENLDTLTRYSSENSEFALSKLGSCSFTNKTSKAKEKIRDIAYDLIKMAATRKLRSALPMDYSIEDYANFCSKFPFVETEDQKNAINDVINDFNKGNPVDRLICGDVGFGKTEVAMRAAFLAVSSGYQVAILVPTTILCNQHYENFKKRFADFPITIKQLSRLVTISNKKIIQKSIEEGSVDIVIGTHALLAKDVKFQNIGLLIVDEEQGFGVVHKEKIKSLKEELHVITMSATPIPRTMEQAFKDLKDLSIMSTPPVDKLPITTYSLPFDILAIKNAIQKEISRNGQVYFVCPRISDIEEMKLILNKLDINITYTTVHGQMPINTLENNMIDFKNHTFDLLLSTNIIETGLDIPNVNTIIIYRAHLFGLSQLYQLRGRVGRSSTQSYAYMLYDTEAGLSELAARRLQILQNLDYLGASFALASYDLELRGSGNLLGEEQSGHVKDIGVELYQKILKKEIMFQKQHNQASNLEFDDDFNPEVNLNAPVLIPKKYIPDMELSIEMYQEIANIENISEIVPLKFEMEDRFGKLPEAVSNLFSSIEIKLLAKQANIDKITMGSKAVIFKFYKGVFKNVDGLMNFIKDSNGIISIKESDSIIFHIVELNTNEIINKIKQILKNIININI